MTTANIDIHKALGDQLLVHTNLGNEVVVTTVDKLRLCLIEHREANAAKASWVAPVSLLISLIATLSAAEFKDIGFKKATWEAIFVLLAIGAGIWLIFTLTRAWKYRKTGSVESLVERIKVASTGS